MLVHGPQRLGPVATEDFLKELGLEWTLDAEESTQAMHFGKGLKVQEMEKGNADNSFPSLATKKGKKSVRNTMIGESLLF